MEKGFATIDIILAAYLKVKGYKLKEIERQGNRGTFIFDAVPQDVVDQYDLGQSLVEPKALNNEIRALATAARR
jgi:hypothetical protein